MAWHWTLQYLSEERQVHDGWAHFFIWSTVIFIRLLKLKMTRRVRA